MEWLTSHKLTNERDVTFILQEVKSFLSEVADAIAEKNRLKRDQWSGIAPYLHLIHCLVDFDKTRAAFQLSFKTMSRIELDNQKSVGFQCDCPWLLMSDKWNDKEFNLESDTYPSLHDDFNQAIDISHNAVSKMGVCTPDKAKEKYSKMKNDLLIVKMNWEKSGNGDGTLDES